VKGLTLSTVHQSKGREFKHVFIIGAHQGMMPHRDGELNEERRIFFVACTRAADTLQISFFKEPSMFLNDFRDQIEETDEGEFLEDEYAEKDE
jgi:superfamily I DNA/RNA helicase